MLVCWIGAEGVVRTCTVVLTEALGEEMFVDPYEIDDLLSYQRAHETTAQRMDLPHRMTGSMLFGAIGKSSSPHNPHLGQSSPHPHLILTSSSPHPHLVLTSSSCS